MAVLIIGWFMYGGNEPGDDDVDVTTEEPAAIEPAPEPEPRRPRLSPHRRLNPHLSPRQHLSRHRRLNPSQRLRPNPHLRQLRNNFYEDELATGGAARAAPSFVQAIDSRLGTAGAFGRFDFQRGEFDMAGFRTPSRPGY